MDEPGWTGDSGDSRDEAAGPAGHVRAERLEAGGGAAWSEAAPPERFILQTSSKSNQFIPY